MMKRRRFLAAGATVGAAAVAGCSGETAPPRRSQVFENVQASNSVLSVTLDSNPKVEARKDAGSGLAPLALLPVGRASAAKGGPGGKGYVGRGSNDGGFKNAPIVHGHALHGGGPYGDEWRDEHGDEIKYYSASIGTAAVAKIGGPQDNEDDLPGYNDSKPDNAETYSDVSAGDTFEYDATQHSEPDGWYRVGTKLKGDRDFGWSFIDVEVNSDASSVGETWKMTPQI